MTRAIAPIGHSSRQAPHPVHFFSSTTAAINTNHLSLFYFSKLFTAAFLIYFTGNLLNIN
jgi:hypothetical protein